MAFMYHAMQALTDNEPAVLLQTGTGQLTPNNPNSVATIVQYGLKRDLLDLTAVGAAEVHRLPCSSWDSEYDLPASR